MKKIIISSLAIVSLLSCNTDFDTNLSEIVTTNGEADFSNYVALGNSLTSGYRDGSLYLDGQLESYPSIIASQMQKAGGGEFTQPLMPDNNGGFTILGIKAQDTKLYISGFSEGSPVIERANNNNPSALSILDGKGTYNNMGVPGAKVAHLLANGYGEYNVFKFLSGTANPYFARFASAPSASVISDFKAKKPTFFSLWIGNNDALLYALAGADSKKESLTPVAQFETYYNALIEQIKSTNAKGVIANIPDVTSIPSLTTIPYNPLTAKTLGKGDVSVGENNIDLLNSNLYGPLKQILTLLNAEDRIQLLSKTEENPLLIKDEALPDLSAQITAIASQSSNPQIKALATYLGKTYGQARQAKKGDLIPLTTKSEIGAKQSGLSLPSALTATLGLKGISYPLEDAYVLTITEVTEISNTIAGYNNIIRNAALSNGYAFVDANAKMVELSKNSGIQYNGVGYTATFVTGGAFSLDGVHLTGKGYAIIANEFIKAINHQYKSNLPQVNPNQYSGIKFP